MKLKYYSVLSLCVLGGLLTTPASVWAAQQTEITISSANVLNPSAVEVVFSNQQHMTLDFYGENIFRMFQDNQGGIVRDPQASPEAQILVDRPRKEVGELSLTDKDGVITISTARIQIEMNKRTSLFKITDKIRQKVVVESARPVDFMEKQVCLSLKAHDNEYFYGGGVQNGRFSHKGKSIRIVNTNQWTDGGVASPTPFYWSTEGYGVMWYTFRPGLYDFGATDKEVGSCRMKKTTWMSFSW